MQKPAVSLKKLRFKQRTELCSKVVWPGSTYGRIGCKTLNIWFAICLSLGTPRKRSDPLVQQLPVQEYGSQSWRHHSLHTYKWKNSSNVFKLSLPALACQELWRLTRPVSRSRELCKRPARPVLGAKAGRLSSLESQSETISKSERQTSWLGEHCKALAPS